MRIFAHKSISLFTTILLLAVWALPLLPSRATSGVDGSPQISNWWFKWDMSESEMEQLSRYDMVLVDVENQVYAPNRLQELRELNPEIVILAYISMSDIRPDATDLDDSTFRGKLGNRLANHPEWILKDQHGDRVEWWPTYKIFNVTNRVPDSTGKKFNSVFPKLVAKNIYASGLWDGVFLDNVWEDASWINDEIDLNQNGQAESASTLDSAWNKGVKKILTRIRNQTDDDWIITGNGGVGYYEYLNGVAFENFPNTGYGDWAASLRQYMFIGNEDQFAIINSNDDNGGNSANYQDFRFGLTSALLGNGYYGFDSGDQTHHELYFYDEYEVAVGNPLGAAYNILNTDNPATLQDGLWRREFENGIVLVNSTDVDRTYILEEGYEKIRGVQDIKTNSGKVVGSAKIAAQDGIILLNRLSKINGDVFINGAAAKVFSDDGEEVRSSFISYDPSFDGGTQIVRLPDVGRIVVAGDTYVDVYDTSNNRLAHFAPYGESFTSGVDIAVDRLEGSAKPYRIVTGTESGGPQVRIYSLLGKLKHTGCFPFDSSWRTGVHVAVGNVDGHRGKEIVVAPAVNGGPHVRILNNQCELIDTGFFAFDSSSRFGLNVTVGNVSGTSKEEIIVAPGPGGGPQVRIFREDGKLLNGGFFAFDSSDRLGVHLSTSDITGDGLVEIIANSFSVFNNL